MSQRQKEVAAVSPKSAATTRQQAPRHCNTCPVMRRSRQTIKRLTGDALLLAILLLVVSALCGYYAYTAHTWEIRANRLENRFKALTIAQSSTLPDYSNNFEAIAALEAGWIQGASASEFGSGD